MQNPTQTVAVAQRNAPLLVLVLLMLAGCGQVNVNYTSSSDRNINGHRTITRTHNKVTRRLESATEIEIKDGHVANFSKAALVKLEEIGGPEQREAELRENAGKLELWIKERGVFRKGTPKDAAWLENFLKDIAEK